MSAESMQQPIRLSPVFLEKVWGTTKLEPWFPDSQVPIGEVWFQAGRELPLLVKLIFTSDRLSIQVHPADGEAAANGKTEMWYILDADPVANIALGFRKPITRERLRDSAKTGDIEALVKLFPVRAGETYFTPAHTVHAIGAGITLCEIQQTSDITYRLWDYGRPREIHVEQAVPICDLGVHPGAAQPKLLADGSEELARCSYFVTELVKLVPGERRKPEPRTCQIWIALEGEGAIGKWQYRRSEAWLLPESGEQPEICAASPSKFLRTYVP